MGCEVSLDDTASPSAAPARSTASTSTCTTSASSRPRSPRSARWPTRPRTCAGSATSAHHETDRLAALAAELGNLGADVTEHPDGLSIRPAALHGGVFRTYADHRMAHAGVIIGSAVDGVLVENIATTAKTFPDFAGAWLDLVARIGWAQCERPLHRSRRRALRATPSPHPAPHQGPPDLRRRRRRRGRHRRPRPVHAADRRRHGDGDEVPAAGPQGRRRRRPRARRRRRVRGRRVAGADRRGRAADDHAAAYGR